MVILAAIIIGLPSAIGLIVNIVQLRDAIALQQNKQKFVLGIIGWTLALTIVFAFATTALSSSPGQTPSIVGVIGSTSTAIATTPSPTAASISTPTATTAPTPIPTPTPTPTPTSPPVPATYDMAGVVNSFNVDGNPTKYSIHLILTINDKTNLSGRIFIGGGEEVFMGGSIDENGGIDFMSGGYPNNVHWWGTLSKSTHSVTDGKMNGNGTTDGKTGTWSVS